MDRLKEFITYLTSEKRYSPHTCIAYQNDLVQFKQFIENELGLSSLEVVNYKNIRAWIFYLLENGDTARSVNRKISSLKTFYKFLLRNQYIEINPLDKVITPKQSKRLPSFMDESEISNLFSRIEFPDTFEGVRNKTIIETFYALGLRLSELIHLRYQDFDFYQRNVKVLGKRNKERIIPFGPHLESCLKYYFSVYENNFGALQQNMPIFVTKKGRKIYAKLVYEIVHKHIEMVSTVEQKSPHIIRHTFATHLLNQGADLNAIKELLGHSSLAATQVYTHTSIGKLKEIYNKAHPRA
ncbi:MAG: tyrosine-type recombinase/integrase [Bacteroidales bacterium]|jgi:integrase/recombinase XerC|nr:tyrosine-type recombinase/integrase [Bacteroidales bacterium]MDD2687783.1 tyrosine-type recombinase/integrase [Bacteroidales bacterium]MDD3329980.1 tyrosine-type recombinase/integrase [Bacteroidales bacterium]MDD3690671.1 tyrosine-type recombinase/integrase [Bacteroidales bacterium]MDD4043829.1 tyrosine-type recombinase/integrase [Bacteroidales bacterium]